MKSPSFIYAAFRAEKPEKMAKSASSSESWASGNGADKVQIEASFHEAISPLELELDPWLYSQRYIVWRSGGQRDSEAV